MQPRTLTITTVLLDLKNAFLDLLREERKNPALIMLYTFIDTCAALVNDGKTQNREIFQACVDGHVPTLPRKRFTSYDLWAARSSLLHSYSPLGYHTEKGAKPIFYYWWPERREAMQKILESKYAEFILLDIEEIKWVAIDILNSIYSHLDKDPAFELRLLKNAEHFLFDLQAFKLEGELSMLQRLAEPRPNP